MMSESASETLTFTGERFLPERGGEIWYEHWHRYALARQFTGQCRVLDVACGEGYGSSLLAEMAASVVGVDISAEAVGHARRRYSHQANLEFVEASCDRMPFPDASFDVAVSFETIEHIHTQAEFIAELKRVLRPDGILILSSPNKRLYSDAHDYHNEFHVRELYRDELEDLLKGTFPHISWLGQKLLFHSAIWAENRPCAATEYLIDDGQTLAAAANPSVEPMYYMVICSRNPAVLPTVDKLSLFSDLTETVYQDYAKQTRGVIELDRQLIDRERLIAERDNLLALRTTQLEQREALIAERDALLVLRNERVALVEGQVAERDVLLALRTTQMSEREALIAERDALLAQRTEQLAHRERLIAERDELLALRTTQLEERDALLAQQAQLQAQQAQQQAQLLDQHALQVADQAQSIAELRQELDQRAGFNWWIQSPLRFLKRAFKANE